MHPKDIKPKCCLTPVVRRTVALSFPCPLAPGGKGCKAGHGGTFARCYACNIPPPALLPSLRVAEYPGSSGLRCSLPLAPCLLTCLWLAGAGGCPHLLPGHLLCPPPPGTRRFLGGGNAGRQERRGLLGTLGLVPWQAPPHRNAIELFGGMKRLPVQPLGSPVPFSPPCCRWGQSIQLSWGYRGCFTLLYNGVAFDVLFLYVSFWLAPLRGRLSRLPANAVAWHRKGEGREERGEQR